MASTNDKNSLTIKTIRPDGLELISGEYSADRTVRFFFTANKGGYSNGACSSLNLSLKVKDDPSAVSRNREKLFSNLNILLKDASIPEQVHGDAVAMITKTGSRSEVNVVPGNDGLITADTEIPLMALFADCLPVVLFDARTKVVGVIHAGWRGTHKAIVRKAVEMIDDKFDVRPEELTAVIGPGISDCCYEIGDELADNFKHHPHAVHYNSGRMYLNLKSVNKEQLQNAGLLKQNILDINICTSCDPSFFSYRRDSGNTGRHAAIIYLTEND